MYISQPGVQCVIKKKTEEAEQVEVKTLKN